MPIFDLLVILAVCVLVEHSRSNLLTQQLLTNMGPTDLPACQRNSILRLDIIESIFITLENEDVLFVYDQADECLDYLLSFLDSHCSHFQDFHISGLESEANSSNSLYTVLERTNQRKEKFVIVYGTRNLILLVSNLARTMDKSMNQHGFYEFEYKWIIISHHPCNDFIDDVRSLDHVLCVSSDVKTLVYTESGRKFNRVSTAVPFNASDKVNLIASVFPNTQYKLNGRECRIGSQYWTPVMFAKNSENSTDEYFGVYYELIKMVTTFLNCTPTIVVPPNNLWGGQWENGSWNGLVGQLERHETDFAVATLTVTFDRMTVMDFADIPLEYSDSVGLYKQKEAESFGMATITKPFSTDVWIAVLVLIMTYPIIITGVSLFEPNLRESAISEVTPQLSNRRLHGVSIQVQLSSYASQLSKVITSFLMQPIFVEKIKRPPNRFLWSAWFVFALILVYVWSANLISYLSVSMTVVPFRTHSELLESDYTYSTIPHTSTDQFFVHSISEVHRKIYKKMESWRNSHPQMNSTFADDHNKLVEGGGHVNIQEGWEDAMRTRSDCSLRRMPEVLFSARYAIGLPHNSAYKPLINNVSLFLLEAGILEHLKETFYAVYEPCDLSTVTTTQASMGLSNMAAIFVLSLALLAGSILVLFIEIVFAKRNDKFCKQWRSFLILKGERRQGTVR